MTRQGTGGMATELRGTVESVDHDTYFTVFGGELVGLEASESLPQGFLSILPGRIEMFLEQPVMTIGTWLDTPDRPHVLVLDGSGTLTSVVAVDGDQLGELPNMLGAIDRWLETMKLRDLSDLLGDPVSFYEGLLDLRPDSTISLSPDRRVVLLTAVEAIDPSSWPPSIGVSSVQIQYFDVLATPGGGSPVITRRTPTMADIARAEHAIAPLADVIDLTTNDGAPNDSASVPVTDAVSGDETSMQSPIPGPSLPPPPTIDLRGDQHLEGSPTPVSPIDASVLRPAPRIRPGATFPIDRLPLLFDPLGANLTSISDELFAVDRHLVLVQKLPERRRETPFEDRNRFRWDCAPADKELLGAHEHAADGEPRVVHLFVESERDGPYCVYIGELDPIDAQSRSSQHAAWFSISPTLDSDLYRLLRKGRLPEHLESPTIDFGTLDA